MDEMQHINVKQQSTSYWAVMLANIDYNFAFLWNQAAEEEEAPAKKEKTHFTVKLTELKAAEKVKLIKEVKNCIQGLNLVQVRVMSTKHNILLQ